MGKKLVVEKGEKYGRLVIVQEVEKQGEKRMFLCKCDCGNNIITQLGALRIGKVKSCGCYHSDILKKMKTTHGLTTHQLYNVWCHIKSRCLDTKSTTYKYYGGRGITICYEWANDFRAFYDFAIANGWKQGLETDRINNDGNYEPSNVRFVTRQVNSQNTRNTKLDAGKVKTIRTLLDKKVKHKIISEQFGVKEKTITAIYKRKSWQNII